MMPSNDTTSTTTSPLATATALLQVESLHDRGDGAFSAQVACIDPTGVTRTLTIEFTWVGAVPGIDLEHAMLDGDIDVGMAVAACNADALHCALARAVHDARTSAA